MSDNRADLPKVATPTLILQGTDDIIAPLEVGHYLHDRIPGSDLRILAATGHCPNLSAPAEVTAAIRAYV
jgi:sigma-B regulation protein RsbQ